MDLPLDHFRLLGVGPATDAQSVLRTLQLRLDRPPDQGYTVETLQARAELLRASADLLSDSERRSAYESDLTALSAADETLIPALEIPTSREVAGLLVLLEAGQPLEAFHLACRALQPPQAPALGSGREADLTLLAGEAALAAAADQSQARHYEQAALILQQGLQLLQRMGQLPELRERIHAQLDALTPFRVLDLLSRDPAASREREEGLALLEQLVQRRGGLEGNQDQSFAPEEFQTFFKQIRTFLTVQEQLDLFQRWGRQGSAAAAFLGTIALTASGFAQRKPERIAAAREQLQASGREGVQPLLANLDLLLGDVEGAIQRFHNGAGPDLRDWANRQSADPLAQVCAWCRDWLGRDVLPGYRDLDADPDLEAYFSDRDVLAWVERDDRRTGRRPPGAAAADDRAPSAPISVAWPGADERTETFGLAGLARFDSADLEGPSPLDAALRGSPRPGRTPRELAPRERGLPGLPIMSGMGSRRTAALLTVAGVGVLMLSAIGLLRPRPQPPVPAADSSLPRARPAASPAPALSTPPPAAATTSATNPRPADSTQPPPSSASSAALPLTATEPTASQLKELLERWLQAKGTVLAGGEPPPNLDRLARPGLLQQLEQQRANDRASGHRQMIDLEVRSVALKQRSSRRIALLADLSYRDATLDRGGRVVQRTAPTQLRNVYVFGRDGDTWRLAASRPAS